MSQARATNVGASTPSNGSVVEVRGLCVNYGRLRALQNVNLEIAPHRITAVIGPSGCGKSTFLNCLNRLTDLVASCRVSGSIDVDGMDVLSKGCDLLSLRRRVGMVFQKPNPFPLSIRRNLSLPLKEHGFKGEELSQRIETVLQDVGLWEEVKGRLDAPAQELSGGQQQRLCIARALALKPDVVLFDEPCSALDPLAGGVVEELIASLRERVTVVIVTHNLAQARRIADDVCVFWMKDGAGTVIESGPAEQVFEGSRDPITARYIAGACG